MAVIAPSQVSFKEILVASDLSEASENVLGYAKAIAKRFGSHIVLVHVSEAVNPIALPEGEWIDEDSGVRAGQDLEAAGNALRAAGFSADAVNTYGDIKEEIQALSEAHHVDLVILGTHGRRGLNRLLFGSEAEELLRCSDRPVLTVGPSAAHPRQDPWAPKNILCATSLIPREARIVGYGYKLANSIGASFALLSVTDPRRSGDEDQAWRAFEVALANDLPEEAIAKGQIHSLLSGRSPATNIVDVARTLKPDLIVMGAKASNFGMSHLRSGVVGKVLTDAPCPVLTISTDI